MLWIFKETLKISGSKRGKYKRGVCRRIQKGRTHQTKEPKKRWPAIWHCILLFRKFLFKRVKNPFQLCLHSFIAPLLTLSASEGRPILPYLSSFCLLQTSLSGRLTPSYDCKVRVFQASDKCLLVFPFFFHWSFEALGGFDF